MYVFGEKSDNKSSVHPGHFNIAEPVNKIKRASIHLFASQWLYASELVIVILSISAYLSFVCVYPASYLAR